MVEQGKTETAGMKAEAPSAENGIVRRPLTAVVIAAASFALAGCNTVEGFGSDVQTAGEGIEEAAEDAKH